MICLFQDLKPEYGTLAGGKGTTLARLYQAGYRVPQRVLGFNERF